MQCSNSALARSKIGLVADFLALHSEDVALQGFVLARVLLECCCVLGDLLLGERSHIGAGSSELRAVRYLVLSRVNGDLAYQARVLGAVLLGGVVLGFAVELTRHLVDKLHGFEFTHSFVGFVHKTDRSRCSLLEVRSFASLIVRS